MLRPRYSGAEYTSTDSQEDVSSVLVSVLVPNFAAEGLKTYWGSALPVRHVHVVRVLSRRG